ncbi:probable low affinity copper uptake protein 2 isoform X2 [Haliotis rufescens]|uniref:probable low affinity copper uptake protein 2 isoform X2 n=1 Tax=Haliotis rufescens TaxID=6454 RepID=UPI00201E916E|nr:probable low affinity copper uptake protein 2 isoform X2 [Haliotis rufescens]
MDMPTYFFTTTELKNFLFKNLNISGAKGFVVLCLLTFLIMALFEGVKLVKIFFELKVKQDPLTYSQTDSSAEDKEGLLSSLMFPADMGQIRRRRMKYHFLGCMSHMFNMIIAYLIMLAFMSYSVWVGIAITLGSVVGYWVFGYVQQHMVERYRKLNQLQMMSIKDHERSGVGYWVFGYVQQHMVERYRKLNQLQMMSIKDHEREEECAAINTTVQPEHCHI